MHLHSKTADRIEFEDKIFSEDAVSEGLRIEEILHRAHQIHRARGGLIGYDLEDWQQAERERMREISQSISESKERSSGHRSLEICTCSSKGWKTGEPS